MPEGGDEACVCVVAVEYIGDWGREEKTGLVTEAVVVRKLAKAGDVWVSKSEAELEVVVVVVSRDGVLFVCNNLVCVVLLNTVLDESSSCWVLTCFLRVERKDFIILHTPAVRLGLEISASRSAVGR